MPYGSSFEGKLHYPVSNRDACSKFTPSDFENDMIFDEVKDMTPILLIDHGGCTHYEKITNAQEAGINAAILIDDSAEEYN